MFDFEKLFFSITPRTRWFLIIGLFALIAILDFGTPPNYILASLYIIPILLSIPFLKPHIAKLLLVLAVIFTIVNSFFPYNVLNIPSVVVNRLLSAFALVVSSFFMVRYIRYQQRIREQAALLASQQNLAEVREDFIATLTHDLKTPLLGEEQAFKHILDEKLGPLTPELREMLSVLQRGSKRQLELVQTLVTTYKNDNIGVQIQLASVDLDELVADVLIEVQTLALERGIRLTYDCVEAPLCVMADALQLKRVLANLIHNALNYTPFEGNIQIQLKNEPHNPDNVLVMVSDTGPGIRPEELNHIFKRFYQSNDNRKMLSTGLGLYLSQQIILAHRGKIWAENLFPHGCRFCFSLPRLAQPEKVI